jgi:GTPase SAR1 family protein
MGKYAQLVMGPAGAGKSTYVNAVRTHLENTKPPRVVHCINLDPAAEVFHFPISINIKDMVSVDEIMEEEGLGPNGGLVQAMEFLLDNLEWFKEELGDYGDDYLIFDCPGQIELYTHLDIMSNFIKQLQLWDYSVRSFCFEN